MIVAGLDLSMSCPALVFADANLDFKYENLEIHYMIGSKKYVGNFNYKGVNFTGMLIPKDYNCNEERWHLIAQWVIDSIGNRNCLGLNLESQSYGSIGTSLCQISEMHGVVKNYLWSNNISIKLTPPSQNKKSFSGKGNATKLEMIDALKTKYKIDLMQEFNINENNLHPVEDIVDAIGLCEIIHKDIQESKNE